MANKSVVTYQPPKDKFIKVGRNIIVKFDAEVIGVYTKIVNLSGGTSLSIPFVAKRIKVSERKVRKVIVLLENDGYVVRNPIKDEKGSFAGWNYIVLAEPVPKSERTHAGRKKEENDESGLGQKPTSPLADNSETCKENIFKDKGNFKYNEMDVINENKKSSNEDKKGSEFDCFMKEHYPYLMRMDIPLTQEQATKLKKTYGEEAILEIFDDMNNYKPLLKNSRDAFKTALNWCRRRGLPTINDEEQ